MCFSLPKEMSLLNPMPLSLQGSAEDMAALAGFPDQAAAAKRFNSCIEGSTGRKESTDEKQKIRAAAYSVCLEDITDEELEELRKTLSTDGLLLRITGKANLKAMCMFGSQGCRYVHPAPSTSFTSATG